MLSIRDKFAKWPSESLSAALIGVGVLLIVLALTIKNPWIKAGILTYEVLP